MGVVCGGECEFWLVGFECVWWRGVVFGDGCFGMCSRILVAIAI